MGKKRRTKREKVIIDLKRQLSQIQTTQKTPQQQESVNNTSYLLGQETPRVPFIYQQVKPKKDYSYVINDVKKTLIVVASIVVINSALFFLLEKQIIRVAFLGL